ncbi:lipocalin family protein [Acetobacteraceae bacterium H6797]|nr:lipocalin family protein [Acetobacteraceae bacterium H6797]
MTIRRAWFLDLLLGVMVLAGIAYFFSAEDKPNEEDERLRRQIIGRWLVPPHSPDYDDERKRMVEEFSPDGQVTLYVYTDATCSQLEGQLSFPYSVKNRIISSVLPNGEGIENEILDITGDTMTLRSLDDDTTYPIVRGHICGRFQAP